VVLDEEELNETSQAVLTKRNTMH